MATTTPKRRAITIDLEIDALMDQRFETLGNHAGYNRYEAHGRMFALWAWVLEKQPQGYVVTEGVVRSFLGPAGVEAILAAGCNELALGERREGGIYVRGSHRFEWLKVRRANAKAGGDARANAPRNDDGTYIKTPKLGASQLPSRAPDDGLEHPAGSQPDSSQQPAAHQPKRSPTPADLQPSPSPLSLKEEENMSGKPDGLVLDSPGLAKLKAKVDRATAPVPGYRECIDDFDARFTAANNGSRPTWDAATGKMLKSLLAKHGAAEVHKRIACLFEQPPSWLTGTVTFKTLVSQFDALIPRAQQLPTRTIPEL